MHWLWRFAYTLLLVGSLSLNLYYYFLLDLRPSQPSEPTAVPQAGGTQVPQPLPAVDTQTAKSAEYQAAQAYFEQNQFRQAMQTYALLDNEAESQGLREEWHSQALTWLTSRQYQAVANLAQAYLELYPYDLAFLEVQALLLSDTEQWPQAIEVYDSLRVNSIEPEQSDLWLQRIHQLAGKQIEQLRKQQAWRQIIDFTEPLMWQDPDHSLYALAVAEAYFQIGDTVQARELLQALQGDPQHEPQVSRWIAKIDASELPPGAIPLQQSGEHYLVEGVINGDINVTLLIDTGASVSTISPEVFADVSAAYATEFIGMVNMNTAGGPTQAEMYQLAQFQIDDYRVEPIRFVVMDLSPMQADGLLGMNFLKNFQFQIDQQQSRLILANNESD